MYPSTLHYILFFIRTKFKITYFRSEVRVKSAGTATETHTLLYIRMIFYSILFYTTIHMTKYFSSGSSYFYIKYLTKVSKPLTFL